MKLEYIVKENKYKTVKDVLKFQFHISDRLLLKLKRHKKIYLNNQPIFVHSQVYENDIVSADIFFHEESENIIANKIPLEIVFEDNAMLIVNKSPKIPVHPSMAYFENSLSNGVKYYFEKNNTYTKIRPVNRLDKDTSRPCHIRKKRICTRVSDSSNSKSLF